MKAHTTGHGQHINTYTRSTYNHNASDNHESTYKSVKIAFEYGDNISWFINLLLLSKNYFDTRLLHTRKRVNSIPSEKLKLGYESYEMRVESKWLNLIKFVDDIGSLSKNVEE